jgi:hypothetical protein
MFFKKNRHHNYFEMKIVFLVFIIVGLFLFDINEDINISNVQAQTMSLDAIAIRVLPNPYHYSAQRWYKEKGFAGSPQSLIVDGYEAVRDGRTVYVNVGNVIDSEPLDTLYTNIYIISYNQDAEASTEIIFSNILSHWKFNTNRLDEGWCRENNTIPCLHDSNCPLGDVCFGNKAKLIRDVRRLSDIGELREIIEDYKQRTGYYPILSAGTYIQYHTLSVWPSWQDEFARQLKSSIPIDPVNKIGECPVGFNEITCWDELNLAFPVELPRLPEDSLVYMYSGDEEGFGYNVCGVFESGFTWDTADIDSCKDVCLDFDEDGYCAPFCPASPPEIPDDCPLDCDDTRADIQEPDEDPESSCGDERDNDCDGFIDCNDNDCAGSDECDTGPGCNRNCICDPGETAADCPMDNCGDPPPCGDNDCHDDCECAGVPYGMGCRCDQDCRCGNGEVDCEGYDNAEECDDGGLCTGDNSTYCESNDDCTVAGGICTPRSGDGCSAGCDWEDAECIDEDGDEYGVGTDEERASCTYFEEDCNDDVSSIHPYALEVCNGIDDDCDDPIEIDEGFDSNDCPEKCEAEGYTWTGREGDLACCGGEGIEAGPYEDMIEITCDDGRDNDCDGDWDGEGSPSPDTDCMTCDDTTTNEGEHYWYISGIPYCNHCYNIYGGVDRIGSQDDDQLDPQWAGVDPATVDRCDSDCGEVDETIEWGDFEEDGEATCDDGLDNDCDGDVDCDDIDDCSSVSPCCTDECTSAGCEDEDNEYTCANTDPADECLEKTIAPCEAGEKCLGTQCESTCIDDDNGNPDGYYKYDDPDCPSGNDCCDDLICVPPLVPYPQFVNPDQDETCDGLDNDCSDSDHYDGVDLGEIDNGCDDDGDDYCDEDMLWFDTTDECDNTTSGTYGDDCCEDSICAPFPADPADVYPGAPEICDGVDNQCPQNSGSVDEGLPLEECQKTCEDSGYAWSENGLPTLNCCGNNPADPYFEPPITQYQELGEFNPDNYCTDGLDNDCDGLIDCDDTDDCEGMVVECPAECTFNISLPCEFTS